MPTKQELEDELNSKLDLDLEWSGMPKDDLTKLNDGLDDQDFVKKFVAYYANERAGDTVEGQIKNWEPGQAVKMIAAMQEGQKNPMDMFF
jgi:hypothetical protein